MLFNYTMAITTELTSRTQYKSYREVGREREAACFIQLIILMFFIVSLNIRRAEDMLLEDKLLEEKIPLKKPSVAALEGKKKSSRCLKQRFRRL